MDPACSPNQERDAFAAAIERCALSLRDIRARSLPMDAGSARVTPHLILSSAAHRSLPSKNRKKWRPPRAQRYRRSIQWITFPIAFLTSTPPNSMDMQCGHCVANRVNPVSKRLRISPGSPWITRLQSGAAPFSCERPTLWLKRASWYCQLGEFVGGFTAQDNC